MKKSFIRGVVGCDVALNSARQKIRSFVVSRGEQSLFKPSVE